MDKLLCLGFMVYGGANTVAVLVVKKSRVPDFEKSLGFRISKKVSGSWFCVHGPNLLNHRDDLGVHGWRRPRGARAGERPGGNGRSPAWFGVSCFMFRVSCFVCGV